MNHSWNCKWTRYTYTPTGPRAVARGRRSTGKTRATTTPRSSLSITDMVIGKEKLIKNLLDSLFPSFPRSVPAARGHLQQLVAGKRPRAGQGTLRPFSDQQGERRRRYIQMNREPIVQTGMDTLYIINYDSKKHQSWRLEYLVGMYFSFALYLLELEKRVMLSK